MTTHKKEEEKIEHPKLKPEVHTPDLDPKTGLKLVREGKLPKGVPHDEPKHKKEK